MNEITFQKYVDHRLDELGKRIDTLKADAYLEIDKRIRALKDDMDDRVGALNEAKHQNTSLVALIVSLLAIIVAATDAVIWAVRR